MRYVTDEEKELMNQIMQKMLRSLDAVSYTHLDVYKRQSQWNLLRNSSHRLFEAVHPFGAEGCHYSKYSSHLE